MLRRVVSSLVSLIILFGCGPSSVATAPSAVETSPSARSSSVSSPDSAPSHTPAPTASAEAIASSPVDDPTSGSFGVLPAPQPPDFVSQVTCTGSIGASDAVAIVQLRGSAEIPGDVVLRDYGDPARPRTACSFGRASIEQLVDSRHVVIAGLGSGAGYAYSYALVELPEVRYQWFHIPHVQSSGVFPQFIVVSPGLDQVLWLNRDPERSGVDEVHLTTSTADRVIATLPDTNTGRCGDAEDSKFGAFTRAGTHLFVLDQPFPSTNSLIVVEGETIVLSVLPPTGNWPEGANPAMALWSATSETLYYRQGCDIWRWTVASGSERFLAGVNWLHPTISPDGNHLAYALLRADGLHDVYLVDLAEGGRPRLIGNGARKLPVFLNSTQLWFRSEGEDQGICGGLTGDRPLIYELSDGSESRSIIDWVRAVWPATSSNF